VSQFTTGAQLTPPAVSLELAWEGQWGYRLNLSSATTITVVQVAAHSVAGLVANGAVIPSAGQFAAVFDISSQHAMDNTAADTGAIVNASLSTTFAVYWCTAGAFAGGLGFSTTMPTRVSGVYLLGNGGNAAGCFFLGWIRVDGSGNVNNTTANRGIINYYNRQSLSLLATPAYVNDNAETTFAMGASLTWAQINGGTGDSVQYIANGEDAIDLGMQAVLGAAAPAGGPYEFGIGDNSTTSADSSACLLGAAAKYSSVSSLLTIVPSAGYRTANMLCMNKNNGLTFIADRARNGATVDPKGTFLVGSVRG